ncbi:hypothetical protein HF1_09380 [Mycoplasma haemofelis str. Langford 1]|uniref:Uncharacterized protein n=1 Tax=Mycoplasma haemofelis (strain Langford 1) TaxID=941640 RepID=E8ZIH5_MYCHL|nr:hypothetical protein [Mycoplasma haemofelis]CBY92946.1 hypothetical protein HF1_09380 [Mycoplasma haemofelis str. Langford 1]
MTNTLKTAMALAGATGAAGGGVLVHKLINKGEDTKSNTISHHIKPEYLLTNTHASQWTHRLDLLGKAQETDLSDDLLSLKKGKTTLTTEDLKGWCAASLKSEFKSREDKKFLNTRLYCGLNMGDSIQGNKVSSSTENKDESLKTQFTKLKTKTATELVSALFAIKDKNNADSSWEGNVALKDWCTKALDMPMEEGLTYDNAKEYCVLTAG